MKLCIYCLEKKPDDQFNREHVVPEAFGKFTDSGLSLKGKRSRSEAGWGAAPGGLRNCS